MTNVFAAAKSAIDMFYEEFERLPSGPKQMAWNITILMHAKKGFFLGENPDFKEVFYAMYDRWAGIIATLLDYITGLRDAMFAVEQNMAIDHYVEYAAMEIRRLMPGFTQTLIPKSLAKAGSDLVDACTAICEHFDAFRQAEENERMYGVFK